MGKHEFLSLLFLVSLSFWGCSKVKYRNPATATGAILLHKDEDKVTIARCESGTTLRSKDRCVSDGIERAVALSELKDLLKWGFGFFDESLSDASSKLKDKALKAYKNLNELKGRDILKGGEGAQEQIKRVERFIEQFGHLTTHKVSLELQNGLSRLQRDFSNISVVREVNGKLDNFIDDIFSNLEFHKSIFSTPNNIVFDLLNAYLEETQRSFSFQSIQPTNGESFEIMTTEVTQRQWFDVMGYNPSKFSDPKYCDDYVKIGASGLCPRHPVESVPRRAVKRFIKRLNERAGIRGCKGKSDDPTGCYRLPRKRNGCL